MLKIEFFLATKYVPCIAQYINARKEYMKMLRQLYQSGFIYLLGEYKFNEFYIPPILLPSKFQESFRHRLALDVDVVNSLRQRWIHIFDRSSIVYIVGGAGYGKSLFLRNLINNYSKLDINDCENYLIIYCDFKTYYSNGNSNKKTIVDFFQESMINATGAEHITKEMIQFYLRTGRCLILLDALDEVPKDVRNELHRKIVSFLLNSNPSNKVCITSRIRGFIPQKEIAVTEIYPLIEKDIADYLDKMIELKKFKKSDKETFMEQAKVLIDKEFLNNFLVLSLLVNIYKAEKALPENKIDLYKKCFEYIAKKREEEKSKTGFNWSNIYPLMKDKGMLKALGTLL